MYASHAIGFLFCLGLFGLACHRPLPEPSRTPRYPKRQLSSSLDVDAVLAGYAEQVASPQAVSARELSAGAVRRLALENSPEVLLARTRVEQAAAHLEAARAWPNPELDGRVLLDGDGRLFSEAAFRFVLPLGGRLGAAAEEAARELDQARLNLVVTRRAALSRVDRTLARLAHARARRGLLSSMAGRLGKYAELARTRRATSKADPLEVALVLADARSDRREVQKARTKVENLERRLRLEIGLPPGEGSFRLKEQTRARLKEEPDALGREAAEHNAGVLQSRLDVLVAEKKAARVAAERLPDLHLGPALTSEGGGLALGISLGVQVPLWQTGRGPYREALAGRAAALEAYHASLRAAVSRVAATLARLESRQRELDELQTEASQALEEAVALAELRYTAGKLDVLKLLSVHRAYSRLNLEKLDLLLSIHLSLVDLRDAVGRNLKIEEDGP